MKSCMHLLLCFLLLITNTTSQSIIKILPGYPGPLPFKLETGYISVGAEDEIELFYYFIESERDPETDPLLFWHTGGPGCSGLSGLLIEIDSPIGTGFSYSNKSNAYLSCDTKSANANYLFLRKWLLKHPKFLKNRLYVAGDSYGGKIATMVALEIAKGNEAGLQPRMLLQGYIIGNSRTGNKDSNERIPYAHRMALISDEYFELAKSGCHGEYVNPDPNNYKCKYALELIRECTKLINDIHILEPRCRYMSPRPNDILSGQLFLEDDPLDLLVLSRQDKPWCRNHNYVPIYVWANNETVQEALHIKKGTITSWTRCNMTIVYMNMAYKEDVKSIFRHYQLLNEKGYQALAYSGDHDMYVPYLSTLKWIQALNLTVDDKWRPWYVGGQVAGYTEKYKNYNQAFITFATVKGAGHIAPEYKPKECLAMIDRWLSLFPL
ncbi:Serine carboxypeptidases (lysosomal cathepsin A) [Handroanthus impetiginosus]|uniref:Serine carboxypeptidases (Lysosomal cathepsin A) n=1 Tax=Handroanthus impetiginosus TaxID=429701 RepID=A0A2G9G3J0_9LAMI|nr:Serine carboxypeptidases (lysosomal cathepsin A) [Handroanthus impetiginosus]